MKRALGGVSAGGIGTPEFEVTHSGGGPCAFVASQPGGNVGGVTASTVFDLCGPVASSPDRAAALVWGRRRGY